MKAIRVHEFGGPEVLRLEETPEPEARAGQVLVDVRAIGVNPVDTYIRSGMYAPGPTLPYTPGSDAAGLAAVVGDDVRRVTPGDRVYVASSLTGTYAERTLCAESQVHPLPDELSFAQGAAIGVPCATAYAALFQRARAVAGETVLVHGASGGVGTAAVQLAAAAGLTVIATAGSEDGRRLVATLGAAHVLDHSDPAHFDTVCALSNGGADVIIEMLANVNLGRDLTALAPGGRVVVVGSRGPVEIDARELMRRDAEILGMLLGNQTADELVAIHDALGRLLASGALVPVVDRELPLSEATGAHTEIMERRARGKIVLIP
jgi:NADPH2:quinone reductase